MPHQLCMLDAYLVCISTSMTVGVLKSNFKNHYSDCSRRRRIYPSYNSLSRSKFLPISP